MLYTQDLEQSGASVQMFTNPAFGSVRTAGTADNPLFCLADVCSAIGIARPTVVKSRLDEDDVCQIDTIDSLGRPQPMNYVTESGLYDVVLRSDSPQAKPFRKWVTSEVLPAIRRQGGYIQAGEQDSDADIMARALMIAQKTIDSKQQRIQMLEGERDTLQQQNRLLAPKAQYTDEVLQSTSTITFTELAKELNFRSAHALLERCVKDRILYRQSGRYLPMARYADKGFFKSRVHKFFHSDGSVGTSTATVITEKGREFFHNRFNNQNV